MARIIQQGVYLGAPEARARPFENEAAFFFTLADGMIIEVRAIGDGSWADDKTVG